MEGLGPEGETPRELFADPPRIPNPNELRDRLMHAKQRAYNKKLRELRTGMDLGDAPV